MGYRSEVVMGFANNKTMKPVIKEFKELLNKFNLISHNMFWDLFYETDYCVYFSHPALKWRNDYKDVNALTTFFDQALDKYGDDDCFFIRVGEEVGDCEIKGNPYLYGIGLRWGISFDV